MAEARDTVIAWACALAVVAGYLAVWVIVFVASVTAVSREYGGVPGMLVGLVLVAAAFWLPILIIIARDKLDG